MPELQLSDVTPATLPLLQAALERLSAELGDAHRMGPETLRAALFGPHPACYAVLALGRDDAVMGAALYSPAVSTITGGAGTYVSDLWVAAPARGQACGRRLLAHVARRSQRLWQARFIRLVSYAANHRARAFYCGLGFAEKPEELVLQLSGDALEQLSG